MLLDEDTGTTTDKPALTDEQRDRAELFVMDVANSSGNSVVAHVGGANFASEFADRIDRNRVLHRSARAIEAIMREELGI